MAQEQVYTIGGDPEQGYAAYDLMGRLCGAGETFGECVDSIRNRQRSGWLTPGPIYRRIEDAA